MSEKKKLEQMFFIGEIAEQAQVAPSTIRYYEKIGLIPKAARLSGRRRYDLSVIKTLKLIRSAQGVGWSLAEINSLLLGGSEFTDVMDSWKQGAPKKIQELDLIIEKTLKMRQALSLSLDCTCQDIDGCSIFT